MKTVCREHGDCMVNASQQKMGAKVFAVRYTVIGSKKTILDFTVLNNGARLPVAK